MLENKITSDFHLAIKIILFVLFLVLLYFIRDIILILIFSYILATIFMPVVNWCQKKGISRFVSTFFIYLILILVFIGGLILIAPTLKNEISNFSSNLSSYKVFFQSAINNVDKFFPKVISGNSWWQNGIFSFGAGAFSFLSGTVQSIWVGFLIMVISFYLIVDKDAVERFFTFFVAKKYHHFICRLISLSQEKLSQWGWGMLILILLSGVLIYFGLLIFNVHGALLLAIIAGLAGIIPLIGPYIGAVPAVILSLLDSPNKFLIIVILYFVVYQIKDSFFAPIVMKKAVGLNPVLVIMAILIGAKIGGILGAIIAIPVTAMIFISLKEYFNLKNQPI